MAQTEFHYLPERAGDDHFYPAKFLGEWSYEPDKHHKFVQQLANFTRHTYAAVGRNVRVVSKNHSLNRPLA
jgi:hypothetical protein